MKRLVKYLGIFIIVMFSVVSVYLSMIYRSIPEQSSLKEVFLYTTFFEDRFFDLRMKQTIDETVKDDRMVLADIDDYSIRNLGSWPIDRSNWATLIEKLKLYGAKIIAFDVFFSEESKTCNGFNPDDELARAIESFHEIPNNRVILPYNLDLAGSENFETTPEDLYGFSFTSKTGGEAYELLPTTVSTSVYPIRKLIDAEPSLGFIEARADKDGIMRHYRALANIYKEIYVPSYGLSVYQHTTGELEEGAAENGVKGTSLNLLTLDEPYIETEKGKVYLNEIGETKMRWSGGIQKFPRASIYDIISKADDDQEMHEMFKNKIVFVGASAFGAYDLRHTPIDPMLPGVYFHMNFTKMLLDGNFLQPFSESVKYSWALLLISVLLLLLIQLRENPVLDIFTVVVILGSVYYWDTYYLIPKGYENRLFFCFLAVIGCYSWNTFVHFYMANQDKAFLKNAFGNYISPELIDEMYSTGEPPKLGGDSGIRTAFFTDIQGFSTFSEKLSPTQLVELLNEYLTVMTDILLEEKGTLDKYEGDAIIAFFGAPMPLEDHARRACIVAHRMQMALLKLRDKWTAEGDKWPKIVHDMRMRIGLNSGEIVTGNMGSASRMNYTMMGDSVNLAARLEESAKQYGIFTQVAKDTVDLAGDEFIFRELDTIRVVGKSVPVTTYDLLGLKGESEAFLEELAEKFKEGIESYKSQQWDKAIAIFTYTLELEYQRFPDLKGVKTNPSEIYIKRCEDYKKLPPPPEWDGVFTLTSK
ncbi:adenylate/guanylate cyclase domain-containing protein [Bacteriovorax sp. Seq25_V]|uniref:adenylate/guanylate cyclase domain-containing protein n=1 Tax=Bacteriovorax sp. Seq25_V TaxID=1201288 RepID=UPI00038A3316|nr:adenylate/guanylate cyclase domain-containing protein [Bacteriovorax sp. Seq25_V]EQC46005.1 CHASE2 domain protein [Bacteriovorax sp. Seq25_V]